MRKRYSATEHPCLIPCLMENFLVIHPLTQILAFAPLNSILVMFVNFVGKPILSMDLNKNSRSTLS